MALRCVKHTHLGEWCPTPSARRMHPLPAAQGLWQQLGTQMEYCLHVPVGTISTKVDLNFRIKCCWNFFALCCCKEAARTFSRKRGGGRQGILDTNYLVRNCNEIT